MEEEFSSSMEEEEFNSMEEEFSSSMEEEEFSSLNSMEEEVPSLSSEIYTKAMTENNNFVPSPICEICIKPMTENNNFNNENRCAHPFCIDCIAKYIEVKLMEEQTAEVSCPALNCGQLLDPLTCRSILPAALFQRWCDFLCESAVLSCQSSVYCPFTECSALVLNECGENHITKSECPNCKKLFCFHCKIPWHVGLRCNQTEQQLRDENDILFCNLVKTKGWTRCPSCKFYVMKIDGCGMIRCRCGVYFCYVCGNISNACSCHRGNGPLVDPVYETDYNFMGGYVTRRVCQIFLFVAFFSCCFIPPIVYYINMTKV